MGERPMLDYGKEPMRASFFERVSLRIVYAWIVVVALAWALIALIVVLRLFIR
jgi:hypothetical protein